MVTTDRGSGNALDRLLSDRGTAGSDVTIQPLLPTTELTVVEMGFRRAMARVNLGIADEKHQFSHFKEWTDRTNVRAKLGTAELLHGLANLGFAWRDIARMLGVSVQAIQKWRKGTPASGDNRRNLASVLAACDLIIDEYHIAEVASWFEMAIYPGIPITPLDLWLEGRPDLVFDYASGHTDGEDTLTNLDSEWRERYRDSFEMFRAGDGKLALRVKDV